MDARHHPFDVLSGSVLGITTALVSWRQYFPIPTEAKNEDDGVYLPVHEDDEGYGRRGD